MSDRFEVPQNVIEAMDRAILGDEVGQRRENRHKALRTALDAGLEEWGVLIEQEPAPSYQGVSIGVGSNPRYRLTTPWEHQASHNPSAGAV